MQETIERLLAARKAALAGDFVEAHALASQVRVTYPRSLMALRLLAWTELELGMESETSRFHACRASDPLDPMAEIGLALAASSAGDADSALRHFLRAYELDAGDQPVRLEIKRLGQDLPDSRLADGLVLLRASRYEGAIEHLRVALAASPDDPAAALGLAHALWGVGAREQVYNLSTSLLSNHPHCLHALILLVAAEVAMGRTLRTRELLSRVDQIDPGHLLSHRLLQEVGVVVSSANRKNVTLAAAKLGPASAPPAWRAPAAP